MNEVGLEGIESLQIVRADAHLKIVGGAAKVEINRSTEPQVKRDGGRAEIFLRSHATVRVPAGVAIEVSDCAGHLELDDIAAPIVVGRVGGNFRARRVGALSIQNRVAGGARIHDAGAIDGGEIGGNVRVEGAQSVSLGKVAGNFETSKVKAAIAVERVGENAFVEEAGGAFRSSTIGGKLYAERVGEVDVETIGGKARVMDVSGGVRIGKVRGRLVVMGAGGDVKVAAVGGHAAAAGVGGTLELPQVGGAIDLRGPFPAGKFWGASGRGRISVEVDAGASLDVTASTGWGRVRVFDLDTTNLVRTERNHLQGTLGVEKPETERTRLALETRHADIIFAKAGAHEREYCWRGHGYYAGRRFPGAFEELGEILSEEFGGKIPDVVNSILGAAGQIVANSGAWSGSFVRNVAEEATRNVRDAMAEAERAFGDLGEKLPRDIASSVEEFGRRLSEIIRHAAAEGRARSREGREETRDRIREAALQMRDSIRAAVREARTRHEQPSAGEGAGERQPESGGPRTQPFTSASYRGDIMDILNAVKEGRIDPGEADEMIAALMEVERTTESTGSET